MIPSVSLEALDLILPLVKACYVPGDRFIYHIAENMYYVIEGSVLLIHAHQFGDLGHNDLEVPKRHSGRLVHLMKSSFSVYPIL
jgi:hypothetical protein